MIIEIEFDSLAEAQSRGPAVLVERCVRDGLRLLESPTYCERDGRGVLSVEVADGGVLDIAAHELARNDADVEPMLVSAAKAFAQLAASAGVAARATSDQPAASVAVQPEIDQ